MSADPKRLGTAPSLTDLFSRVRALERLNRQAPYLFVSRLVAPGDTDAIPSDGADHVVNLDPALGSVSWGPQDTETYELVDIGAGNYGIQFNENGLYRAYAWAGMFISGSAAAGATARLTLAGANQTIGASDVVPWLTDIGGGANQLAQPSRIAIFNLPTGYGAPPLFSHVTLGHNAGTPSGFTLDLLIVQQDSLGSTDF